MRIDGGEAERVTDVKTAVQSFAWSPDGKRIAYIAADPAPEAKEKEKKDGFDQIVVDADYQFAHINVIDLSSSSNAEMPKPTKLTDGALHITELDWSPDGRYIAFTARSTPKLADGSTTELYAIDAGNKQPTQPGKLTNNDRAESNIAWSPDGKTLSYLSTSDKYPTIGPSRIHLLSLIEVETKTGPLSIRGFAAQGAPKILQPQFNGYIAKHEWSFDGKFIYFTADVGVYRRIYRLATDGLKLETRSEENKIQGSFSLSQKNDLMAYLSEDATHPADVMITSSGSEVSSQSVSLTKPLTHMNPQADEFRARSRRSSQMEKLKGWARDRRLARLPD